MSTKQELVQREAPVVTDSTAIIQVIERAASNPAVDIDKMERLLQMQERILERNAKIAFNSAFAEMQAELPVITEKGEIKVNGQVRSKYARFEDINEICRPILHKHGFSVNFKVQTSAAETTVRAILRHKDGHEEAGDPITLKADTSGAKNDVQSIGSSVSYAKRYAMQAALNITSRGEDDDGKAAGGMSPKQKADFEAAIEALVDRPSGEKLWKTIAKACESAKDKNAYDELKAKITTKMKTFEAAK